MTSPVERVYLGYGSTWKTADGSITWTEETDYVKKNPGRSVRRGRSKELDEDRAGTFSLTLKNADRRFDPAHSLGPHFGQILPGVPIKITATPVGGSEVPVARGFVDAWSQEYDRSQGAICRLSCSDGFTKLATAGLPSSVYALTVATDEPDAWYRLTEDAGTTMFDSSPTASHGTYAGGVTFYSQRHPNVYESESGISLPIELSAGSAWRGDTTRSIGASPYVSVSFIAQVKDDPDSVGQFQLYAYRLIHGVGTLGFRIILGRTGAIGVNDPYFLMEATGIGGSPDAQTSSPIDITQPHHYAAVWEDGTTIRLYIDGDEVATGAASAGSLAITDDYLHWTAYGVTIADLAVWEGTLLDDAQIAAQADAFLAPWSGDASGARLGRYLDAVEWPAGLRDIETGDSLLGPAVLDGKALSLAKAVESAELGRLIVTRDGKVRFLNRYAFATETTSATSQATFTDQPGAGIPYSEFAFDLDTSTVLNKIRARRPGGALVEVFDQDSVDAYGERLDDKLDGAAFASDSGATDAANHRLGQYKDPRQRARPIRIPLHALNATHQAIVLGLELGHRVTLSRRPQGVGNTVTTEAFVEGIDHEIGGTNDWSVTVTTAPADAYVVGILDDDTPSTSLARLDTDGSTLASGVSSTATSWSVATPSGPLWTTDAAYFPLNVIVGAEEVRVTAISGASSPQTFTVVRSVNGVVQAHSSSDPVTLADPFVLAF